MKKFLYILGTIGTIAGIYFAYFNPPPTPAPDLSGIKQDIADVNNKLAVLNSSTQDKFGAISIPESPYLFITTLQSNIGTSDTSMTLNSGTYKNGTSLSGYNCFTLDAGTASAEYVCGTSSGTSITSMLRGIDPQNPAATSTSLTFAHRRGADVRITDFPILQIVKRLVNGQDSFPNILTYDSSISTTTLQGNVSNLADVAYVNSVAVLGAPVATTTVQGNVQFATGNQLSAGTIQGSTGAFLVPANSFFNSTTRSATTVPVTLANGKLSQGFFDLTQPFTFTATTTLATTTVTNLIVTTLTVTGTSTGTEPTTLWIPASEMMSNQTYTASTAWLSTTTGISAWNLVGSATTTASASIRVPPNTSSVLAATIVYSYPSTTPANIQWYVSTAAYKLASIATATIDSMPDQVATMPGIANAIVATSVPSSAFDALGTLSTNDVVIFNVTHNGLGASDTDTIGWRLLGIRVTFH